MEGISGIIGFVFIIVFIFISRVQKSAKQQQQNNTTPKSTTLQSQLNRAFQQINDIKNTASEQFNDSQQRNISGTRVQNQQKPAYRSSLEGYQMEGHQVEGYKMEGAKVEGHQVEGYKVEGVKRKHNTKKFDRNSIAVTESSMRRGYAGEGCDEHYGMDLAYTNSDVKTENKKSLYFSDNPIIQGVVMSQILERPKRRY